MRCGRTHSGSRMLPKRSGCQPIDFSAGGEERLQIEGLSRDEAATASSFSIRLVVLPVSSILSIGDLELNNFGEVGSPVHISDAKGRWRQAVGCRGSGWRRFSRLWARPKGQVPGVRFR